MCVGFLLAGIGEIDVKANESNVLAVNECNFCCNFYYFFFFTNFKIFSDGR